MFQRNLRPRALRQHPARPDAFSMLSSALALHRPDTSVIYLAGRVGPARRPGLQATVPRTFLLTFAAQASPDHLLNLQLLGQADALFTMDCCANQRSTS